MPAYSFQHLPAIELISQQAIQGTQAEYDHVILVYHDLEAIKKDDAIMTLLASNVHEMAAADAAFDKNVNVLLIPDQRRLITACTGKLNRDHDDVRRYADAAAKAVRRARAAKWTRPLVVVQKPPDMLLEPDGRDATHDYRHYREVALLGALAECYDVLQARELAREQPVDMDKIGLYTVDSLSQEQLQYIQAVEMGRRLAKDIGGADPERMTALRCAEAIELFFAEHCPNVTVRLVKEKAVLEKDYPLLMAVARASEAVPRHAPCVITLEYRSTDQSAVEEELFLVGKGVTYDTGGLDIKTGMNMQNMSKDKCGAAAMAGFMAAVASLRPTRLNVTCKLAMVRNSIGSNGYVSDEILVGRSGVRVRVGNTDAEGRMIMADVLCESKELALQLSNPGKARILTCATLTGHASTAFGPYPVAMDNGPARREGIAASLANAGLSFGDPFEISHLRREEMKAGEAKNSSYDLEQIAASSLRPRRGHQFAATFLQSVSGLDKCGLDGDVRLAYTHLDIAGCPDDSDTGKATGIPVVAMSARFIRNIRSFLLIGGV